MQQFQSGRDSRDASLSDDSAVATQRLDPRGPVLALSVWAGTWLCIQGRAELLVVCAAVGLVGLAWGRRRRLAAAAGVLVLGCLVTAGMRSAAVHSGPVPDLAGQRAVAVIEATVGPGRLSVGSWGDFWAAQARVEKVEARAQTWLAGQQLELVASGEVAREWHGVVAGSRVRVTVRLEPSEPQEAFGAVARVREPLRVIGEPGWLDAAVERVRSGLRETVSGLAEAPRSLLPALVVGDTSLMSEELQEQLRVTGLLHLSAVSGSNLVLLLASLLWFARRVGVRGWWLRGVSVVATAGFVLLCHAEPSVLRAAAMGCVGVAALGWGGRGQGLRFLSWAVTGLLMLDPWLASSAGFTLSVLATAGIVVFARSWTDALAGWLPRGLAEGLAVPLAAQVATLPVVAAISGQVSLVGILANLVAGPLVGPTTVLGFLCAALGWWAPGPAAALGWLAGWGAQGLAWIAALGASLPAAAVPWPSDAPGVGLLAGFSLAVFLLAGFVLRRRWLAVGLGALLVVVLSRPVPVPGWPPAEWAVVQCDVGQGSATVVAVGPAEAVVVDTGTEPQLFDRCLGGLGIERVPLLVVTHFHADHIGGVAALAGREVDAVLLSDAGQSGAGRAAVLAATAGAERLTAVPGMVVAVGGTSVEVVSALPLTAAPGPVGAESSAENDASVVVRIDTGRLTVLATGDIEHTGQAAVLRSGADLKADVLVVPHHGSSDQSPDLLAAVGAPIALIGVGEDNDYGHPTPAALRLLAEACTAAYRTDTQGAIAVAPTDTGFQVTTERPG